MREFRAEKVNSVQRGVLDGAKDNIACDCDGGARRLGDLSRCRRPPAA
jgi:hypothetical protein